MPDAQIGDRCGLAAFAAFYGLSLVVFARTGDKVAQAIAFMTAQRNVGIMLAAAGTALSEAAWLYLALSQVPVYLSPWLLTRGRGRAPPGE